MTARQRGGVGDAAARLPMRAVYAVAELARVARIPSYTLLRLLRKNDVELMQSGRTYYVSLADLRRKLPGLWAGMKALEAAGGLGRRA